MAIIGAHMLLYSSEPETLRAMLRDVFGFPTVDAGGGWLIFALPPAELGTLPGPANSWRGLLSKVPAGLPAVRRRSSRLD